MSSGCIGRMAYTNTRWRECVIWCWCEGGSVREVQASVIGAFGVHHTINAKDVWRHDTLTHIPTGKALMHAAGMNECDDMMALAERLTALGDWNTRSPARLKQLKAAMQTNAH